MTHSCQNEHARSGLWIVAAIHHILVDHVVHSELVSKSRHLYTQLHNLFLNCPLG